MIKSVSLGFVPFNNPDVSIRRLVRDIFPSLKNYPDWEFQLICIDNSTNPNPEIENTLKNSGYDFIYHWNNGINPMLAYATNQIINLAKHKNSIYFCSNHGEMIDPTWIEDIISPLEDESVGMAGHVIPVPYNNTIGKHNVTFPNVHVQGGVFSFNSNILKDNNYKEFNHVFMDVWQSWNLQDQGYKLVHVDSIMSVLTSGDHALEEKIKYVHCWERT